MWDDIDTLKNLSAWLQLIAIVLVFTGGVTQIGRFVDQRKDYLSSLIQKKQFDPIQQAIRIGTAKIEVVAKSAVSRNNHFMDSGAFLGFGKGTTPIMALKSVDSFATSNSDNTAVWSATVNLDATDPSIGQPAYYLRDAEYIQCEFGSLEKDAEIISGKVIVTINSAVRLEIPIPPQKISNGRILARDLTEMRSKLKG